MTVSLKDIRFTTRRPRGDPDGTPVVYPRLLRERAVLPKVAIAIQYFESLVGKQRRDFDPEVLVHFFGDHKLARCIVAALARSYRYHSPALEEVVGQAALERLRRRGLLTPAALRLELYDRLNDLGDGFLRGCDRGAVLAAMEAGLRLRRGELERLLYLDAEEHATLVRAGAAPRAEDVVAQYNFFVLATLLRHAEHVDLTLIPDEAPDEGRGAHPAHAGRAAHRGEAPDEGPDEGRGAPAAGEPAEPRAGAIRRLCAANAVDVRLEPAGRSLHVRLRGRQDGLGLWARHGRRLARTVIQLLERAGAQVAEGAATLALRGRPVALSLTREVRELLGARALPDAGWEASEGWDDAAVAAAVRAPRPAARAGTWSVRRLPEPCAWERGVLVPDVLLQIGSARFLVCAVRSPAHAARLAALAPAAGGDPVAFVGHPATLEPLAAAGATTVALPRFDTAAAAGALRATLSETGETVETGGWQRVA